MRRSICYCEPNSAQAGEVNTWKFVYTPSSTLPKGTKLRFDLQSKGRDIDWEIPTANLKKTRNVIFGVMDKGKILQAHEVQTPSSYVPFFDFSLPSELKAGQNFTIVVGSPKLSGSALTAQGTKAQNYSQRRRTFTLSIDPTGKGKFSDPETYNLDIRGNDLKTIRILAPSFVIKNKRFDIILRFEDEFGNLTGDAPENTLIELSYEHLRENLNWKLFVPETGFISLPNLYFNEQGIYTIQLLNAATKEIFRSSPIKCFATNSKHLFWGMLHGESERHDSTESIENYLRHFRDDKAFNYVGVSPFENVEETPNEVWKLLNQNVSDLNEDDRFSTILGYQWIGTPTSEGVRHIIFSKDNRPLQRKKDSKNNTFKKLYKTYAPKEIIAIPTFSMGKGYDYNFDEFDPEVERVVEIYNSWGCSEMTKKEGNPLPIASGDKKGIQESPEGSIQKALLSGCRFGFTAGGLDDRGLYSDFYEGDQQQYMPGMTAIIAPEHTRQSLFDALYNRSCYATTGERIILGIDISGIAMGKETNTSEKPGLIFNRHIAGYVAGTTDLAKVEIIRNGKVLKTFEPEGYSMDFTYDDLAPLAKVVIDNKDKKSPFVYYYLRVTQADGHMAWSSPIWIDYLPGKTVLKSSVKSTGKPAKPVIIEEEEEDEFDEDDYEL